MVTTTTHRRLDNTSSIEVLTTGTPARVKAVRALVRDSFCALLVQLGVAADSIRGSKVVTDSSLVSLKETCVAPTAHVAPLPSCTVSERESGQPIEQLLSRRRVYSKVTESGRESKTRLSPCEGSEGCSVTTD